MTNSDRADEHENAIAEVNLAEKDPAKAIDRNKDRELPASEDDGAFAQQRDKRDMTRGMQKRISKIVNRYDQRLAEQDARHQREMREMRGQFDKLKVDRSGESSVDEAAHERDMSELERQAAAALEAGDTTKAANLQRQMAKKEAAFFNAKTAAVASSSRAQEREREETPAQRPTGRPDKRPQAAQSFLDANAEWWDDEDHEHVKDYANALHGRLLEDGSDPASTSHYEKIVKAVKKRFPKIAIRVTEEDEEPDDDEADEDQDEPTPRARAAVQHVPSRGAQRQGALRGDKVRITRTDEATMRAVGLDPANQKHLVQFAQEKAELERGGR